MKPSFSKTDNAKRFLAGIEAIDTRGASEACWLACIGEPGHGKTRTLMWYATQKNGIYLRAKANWRPSWMLAEIASELMGSEAGGSTRSLFQIVLRELARQQRPLIIDEAWNTLHDGRLLETLRDLTDIVENLLILGGEQRVTHRLSLRFPQIASRITEIVDFKPASLEDTRLLCHEISEAPIADDLVAEIHRQSAGHLREIKNAIARVEPVGKRNARPVTVADMAGMELCRDRRAGLPVPKR